MISVSNSMSGKDYGIAIEKATVAALTQAGIIVEGAAIAMVPEKTGRLKGSITWAVRNARSHVSGAAGPGDAVSAPTDGYTVHVGSNVDYAQHVEYGTKRSKAKPYLRPALQQNKGVIRRDFAKWVKEFMRRGR